MKNRILLNENELVAESLIEMAKRQYGNWNKLNEALIVMKLDAKEIQGIDKLDEKIKENFQFPNASKEFNLEALGYVKSYEKAVKILKANDWSREEPTPKKIEAIKEKSRIYTTSDKQIEAYELGQRMVADMIKAKELGLIANYEHFYFSSGGNSEPYRLNETALKRIVSRIE